jgi:hypothetical protein
LSRNNYGHFSLALMNSASFLPNPIPAFHIMRRNEQMLGSVPGAQRGNPQRIVNRELEPLHPLDQPVQPSKVPGRLGLEFCGLLGL